MAVPLESPFESYFGMKAAPSSSLPPLTAIPVGDTQGEQNFANRAATKTRNRLYDESIKKTARSSKYGSRKRPMEDRLKLVRRVVDGKESLRSVAQSAGMSHTTLQDWVRIYRNQSKTMNDADITNLQIKPFGRPSYLSKTATKALIEETEKMREAGANLDYQWFMYVASLDNAVVLSKYFD